MYCTYNLHVHTELSQMKLNAAACNTVSLVKVLAHGCETALNKGKVEGVRQCLTCFVRTTVVSAEHSRGW